MTNDQIARKRLENKLRKLLEYVTGGNHSDIDCGIEQMRLWVDDWRQGVCYRCGKKQDTAAGNWIHVKDRVPERGQRAMFVDKEKKKIHVGKYSGKGGGGADLFLADARLLTANWWMPLPELPQEEK